MYILLLTGRKYEIRNFDFNQGHEILTSQYYDLFQFVRIQRYKYVFCQII